MLNKIKWWGYMHTNGSLQVKRYFDERDLSEANESPFVETVYPPFEAGGHEHAIQILKEKIK